MIATNEMPKMLDINLSIELSPQCPTPAPVSECNPDWAIFKREDVQQKIYMIRATKSTAINEPLRPMEVAKIKCSKNILQPLISTTARNHHQRSEESRC